MKWKLGLALFIVGVTEILVTGWLYERLGPLNLISLYVATTALGALFLSVRFPKFRKMWRALGHYERKRRAFGKGLPFTRDEWDAWGYPLVFWFTYIAAAILIALPGIVTDVVGVLLAVPVATNWLARYVERHTVKNAVVQLQP
jgi:UPF0716 family protein affecting phage T7 exclusion